jgi:polar amino acid transport system permease protein
MSGWSQVTDPVATRPVPDVPTEDVRAGAHIPLDAPVVAPRHWGRIAFAAVVVALLALVVVTLAGGQIQWSSVPGYFVDPRILEGVVGTLILTAVAMALGIAVGVVVAVMRSSSNPVLKSIAVGYVWLFRAVPTLVQLLLWFNLALLLPEISVPGLFSAETNTIMTPFLAALLGLGLSEGAYMAEIVRGGIEGIDRGQVEAAKSLGMSVGRTMRRIILPQATRLVVPPTGNEAISMLKYTSLAFVISYSELLSQGKKIFQINFEVLEVLFACSLWYLVLVTILSLGQRELERSLARGQGVGEVRAARRRRSTGGWGDR